MLMILVAKPEGNRPPGRPRRRWVDNIKMDVRMGGMDWIYLAQDRDDWRTLVNTVTNFQVAQIAGKFLKSCTTAGFSRRSQLHKVS
jgi:hypothetical protein